MTGNGHYEADNRKRRTAAEVINQALLAEGMTPNEIEQERRLADIFEDQLASGRTVDEINSAWNNKTPYEILRDYAGELLLPTSSGQTT